MDDVQRGTVSPPSAGSGQRRMHICLKNLYDALLNPLSGTLMQCRNRLVAATALALTTLFLA